MTAERIQGFVPKMLRLVEVAQSFDGTRETGPNKGPMIEEFQKAVDGKAQGEPYCAGFVWYCLKKVNAEFTCGSILYPSESCVQIWNKTPISARLDKPIVGTIMIWQFYEYVGNVREWRPKSAGHCGIVTKTFPDKPFVETVEGNTGPGTRVIREGEGVYIKKRLVTGLNEMRVLGWLLPWV